MNRTITMTLGALVVALSGCTMAIPGPEQSAQAPQLNGDIGSTSNVWNDPNLFGPVPPEMQAAGDRACGSENYGRAAGYHAHAKRADGTENPVGGFMCGNGTSEQIAAREQRIITAGNRPNRMN